VEPRIDALASEPRPAGCVQLQGEPVLYRIRVGEYRIVYSVDDAAAEVRVLAMDHRSRVYRRH
jgi:mRNA interferase RelE/StbE